MRKLRGSEAAPGTRGRAGSADGGPCHDKLFGREPPDVGVEAEGKGRLGVTAGVMHNPERHREGVHNGGAPVFGDANEREVDEGVGVGREVLRAWAPGGRAAVDGQQLQGPAVVEVGAGVVHGELVKLCVMGMQVEGVGRGVVGTPAAC